MTVTSQITSLNIETLSSSAVLGKIQVSGRVDGEVTVNARPQRPWLATVDVAFDNFRTTHPVARQFRTKAVSGNITGSAIIGRRQMNIKEMVIQSDMWKAEVSGVLMPGRPLSASRLDLKANVRGEARSSVSVNRRPSKPNQNGAHLPKGLISFIIRGTLEKPSIQMRLAAD